MYIAINRDWRELSVYLVQFTQTVLYTDILFWPTQFSVQIIIFKSDIFDFICELRTVIEQQKKKNVI